MLEFGARSTGEPSEPHVIRCDAAIHLEAVEFPTARPQVMRAERTFWEKATILHAEYHRDAAKPIRDRFSRHYSDTAAIAKRAEIGTVLANSELRQHVADWKSRFFPSSWARYDLAKPGTFHLTPQESRMAELDKDYLAMGPMFLNEPPPFATIVKTLSDLESRINQ